MISQDRNPERPHDAGSGLLHPTNGALEMVPEPQVIVIQERDERSARHGDADVVRSRLLADVDLEVHESDSWIIERGNDRLGVVGAVVADDDQFEIVECLAQNASNRVLNDVAAVVGGHHHADRRQLLGHSHIIRAGGLVGLGAVLAATVAAMGQFCQIERDGRLLIVTLDRPEVMNALHVLAHRELDAVFNDFAADPGLWVAIITGAGDRAFSAGNDLKYQAAGGDRSGQPASGFAGITSRYDLNKPVIAAVNGVAMGGGFEIALACDLIIAAENSVFALPEVRVGLAALAGGVHRLPRTIGTKHALGMILTGRRVSAAEGAALGFVNEVVPVGQAVEGARRWAAQILEASPMSVRASKQAVYQGLEHAGVQAAHVGSYSAVTEMVKSQDFIEGPKAFAEKRPPNWAGR